jgi:hypothetical protein
MNRYATLWLILLAGLLTLLNALKPLTIDDPVYLAYATYIAEHPGDPYGFVLFGFDSAHHTLAPPVVPYYWAGVLRLLGDNPLHWKLAFFPFTLLFVFSLHRLFRRFAVGLEMPLTVMLALSPAFLPAWNLMLDVPALALSLAALVLFFHAVEGGSLGSAALAGLTAGVAMQTKYTAFVAPAVMLLYGLLSRRVGYGVVAASLALLVFVSWEAFTAARYGEAHFLVHVGQRRGGLLLKQRLILPLLATLGGVASGSGLLALVALGVSRRGVLLAAIAVVMGFAVVAFVPESYQVLVRTADGAARMTLNGIIFGLFGVVMALATFAVIRRLRQVSLDMPRIEWFLFLWLGLEMAGYFALTPYPAARRVLGVVVIGTLLAGRLAAQTCVAGERRRLVFLPVFVSILLGLGYFAVDYRESRAQAKAAQQAARWIQRHDPHATIWFIGTQGFPYYAERAGMARLGPSSVIQPGSWCVSDGTEVNDEQALFPHQLPKHMLQVSDVVPLRTQLCYYGSGTPLERLDGPRVVVRIYRK